MANALVLQKFSGLESVKPIFTSNIKSGIELGFWYSWAKKMSTEKLIVISNV